MVWLNLVRDNNTCVIWSFYFIFLMLLLELYYSLMRNSLRCAPILTLKWKCLYRPFPLKFPI